MRDAHRSARRSILVEGPLKGDYSLAIVNRSFARALINLGHDVKVTSKNENLAEDPLFNGEPAVKAAYVENPNSAAFEVHSSFNWPLETGHMRAPLRTLHCYTWEESEFPPRLVEQLNRDLHLICVATLYTKEALENSGVRVPMVITGIGLDHMLCRAVRPLKRNKKFRFLHISSCFPRKGADVLARAFVEEFGEEPDVELVIKTFDNPHNEIEKQLLQAGGGAMPRGVQLLKASLSPEELYRLYLSADCLVAPSRGEGFLLPAAEAMALNVPVIVTDAGGQADFCDRQTAWLVRSTTGRAETHMALANSYWFEPELQSLKTQMRAVYNASLTELAVKTRVARSRVASHYTWEKVAKRFIAAVERRQAELAAAPPKRYRVALVSTWNQECGIASYSEHLVNAAPADFEIAVISEDVKSAVNDPAFVTRVWTRNLNGVRMLCDFILRSSFDAVLIQHQVTLFDFGSLRFMLEALCRTEPRRLPVFLQMHSTLESKTAMKDMASTLAKLSGLFVHTLSDIHALPRLAQSTRVAAIPHGVADLSERRAKSQSKSANGEFRIGAFGFCMPHKGVIEHIKALGMLRDRIPNLRVTLLHSLNDEPKTINYALEVMTLIKRLRLDDVIRH